MERLTCTDKPVLKTWIHSTEALQRLAAYEDTGLEPEEIMEALKIKNGGVYELPHIFGLTFEEVGELVQAKAQGRLLVLPCKVGDTVYTVNKIRGDYRIDGWKAVEIAMDKTSQIIVLEQRNPPLRSRSGCDFEAFGVSAFLTREEAEAALGIRGGRKMRVLVACEESQAVCKAFRELGHEAYSCDILQCSGGHPEWHINGDVLPITMRLPKEERSRVRSKTFPGIAKAMAEQWGGCELEAQKGGEGNG